ncbi:hypothetical protein BMS3Bbin04_01277 [bacterium BMS3Bbin04]|nr:hypothetical protein BMS3Bbin04_01277 [bacterium BMS3Bbin04]
MNRMMRVGVLLVVLVPWLSAWAWHPVESIASKRIWLYDAQGDSIANPYESSLDLDSVHPEITRIVINVHGSNREWTIAYDRIFDAYDHHDRDIIDQTLVVTPQFLYAMDYRLFRCDGFAILLGQHPTSWA